MDRTERFYHIDQLLQTRRATSIEDLIQELGVSIATVKRDLTYLRDRLHAPIIWDNQLHGYRYADPEPGFPKFSLPGLWFNSSELLALLTMEHLLSNVQPGVLASHVSPLKHRVRKLLDHGDHSIEELIRRIRIVSSTKPFVDSTIFQKITDAVLSRVQLFACHLDRRTNETVSRHISPQRLVYYQENWYLDGWCHLRDGLRTFRLANFIQVELTELAAIDIEEAKLDAELTAGFGLFVGQHIQQAILRFDPLASRWVALEQWHSNQQAKFDMEGRLILTVPYANDPELISRILKYGPDVEVLQPRNLRDKVAAKLKKASCHYQRSNHDPMD